ncbi:MAG: hypothetical protein WEF53_11080 [Bacteroidota bacterium]
MMSAYIGLKLILLCIILNLLRYYVIGFVEGLVIMGPLFGAMEKNLSYFNTNFEAIDWITSYFYNFVMWLTVTVAFHKVHPHLKGSLPVRSLKVYGFFVIVFASISAIYMNHYSHSKDFYLYSILDAVLVFSLLGLANGFLYPLIFRQHPEAHS